MPANPAQGPEFRVEVVDVRDESDCVRSFQLAAADGAALPGWEPGAHLEVILPSGLVRQYSLCGEPGVNDRYRVAVLREPNSRGGSDEMHDAVVPGTSLVIRGPRNHFPLVDAPSYLFIAGGVGITPILPMLRRVAGSGKPWRLVYGGRSTASMAFLDEVAALSGGSIDIVPQDERGLPALAVELKSLADGGLVYCCGPEGLLVAVEELCRESGLDGALHLERFGPKSQPESEEPAGKEQPFEIELARSGAVLSVPADRSILEVARERVPGLASSCEEGYCGTCETAVLGGVPDHRDTVLDEDEKAANDTMMICVGRAKSPRLVLDI